MRVVYIADNGTEFETEQECMEYEAPLDAFKVKELDELWIYSTEDSVSIFIIRNFKKISEIMNSF